ncbi:Rho GTPase activation protein [Halteromyces radiatus]|uniref:Rho GTPase activation protein n=1 Tax=Halteromyces radiatus TaxID=101107 RepID=UPI0022210378|nr:Rho GTPase activation protein [Halteromyces radiatus]KAI8096562.1 Rho GTPase activation protein [Halteromyces radiatus]
MLQQQPKRQIKPSYWSEPENIKKLIKCQALARKWLSRREFEKVQEIHRSTFFQSHVNHLQARVRGVLCRRELENKRITFETCNEQWVIKLQTNCRGYLARLKLNRLLDSIDRNVRKEGFTMNRLVHNVQQELVSQKNPSVGTVKNFIHLLDDSDLDYNSEVKLESIRQEVIQSIRDNNQLDVHVNTIDTKIALLVRNAITIDEVLKVTGPLRKKEQHRRFSQMAAAAEAEASSQSVNPFTLRNINQKNQNALDLYQQLVYLLQTDPKHLAKLVSITRVQDFGGDGDGHKRIESTILALFGYATNSREEYLLINLCRFCIDEEIKHVQSPQEFMRGNYSFMKLVVQTNRGAKEREFFRTILTPLVNEVVNNEFLDLETDPVGIYHKVMNDEESRTGLPSRRKHAVNSQEALADEEVRNVFITHLRNLREITEKFLIAITSTLDALPYGIRAVARELRLVLEHKFPNESSENVTKILAYFIYYRYLNPAIVAPEHYDVIDGSINPHQRKNLAEISRMLQQISSGKIFDADDMFLAPLNDYVFHAGQRFAEWFLKVADVEDPETHFGMDALDDHARTQKPTIYISPYELCHLHYMIEQHIEVLAPKKQGTLFEIISDLGPSPFKPGVQLPTTVWCLRLTNRDDDIPQDSTAQLQQLIVDTKRLVVYIIQIQSGPNLLDIFQQPVTDIHEAQWMEIKQREFLPHKDQGVNYHESIAKKRRSLKLGNTPLDINNLTFFQLKTITSRLAAHLEKFVDRITQQDNYQGLLNMIAEDITGKNTRRQTREKEITKLKTTLGHLQAKKAYLSDQRQSYEDYLKLSMDTMAQKKQRGKKQRYMWPFTRQYFHMRNLTKQGKLPTFGSYKYTAKQLHDRGVIITLEGVEKKHYDRIDITLSMDEAGIVNLEGRYANWSATSIYMDIQYEQLLQTQFEGVQTMTLLEGMIKVNVNLLIYMINKK